MSLRLSTGGLYLQGFNYETCAHVICDYRRMEEDQWCKWRIFSSLSCCPEYVDISVLYHPLFGAMKGFNIYFSLTSDECRCS